MSDTVYTVPEVAELLAISASGLYAQIQAGIPITCGALAVYPIVINGRKVYGRAAIDSLLSHVVTASA